jgi:hypothetical protein
MLVGSVPETVVAGVPGMLGEGRSRGVRIGEHGRRRARRRLSASIESTYLYMNIVLGFRDLGVLTKTTSDQVICCYLVSAGVGQSSIF